MGLLLGAWQAFWIAYMRIPPFIVTLAGMLTFRGLAWSTLDGKTISPFPMEFTRFFNSYIPASGGATLTVSIIVGAVICAMFVVMQLVTRASKAKKGYQVDAVPWLVAKLVLIPAVVMWVFWLLGQDKGIPVILILLAVVVLVYNYFTSNTVPGRYLDVYKRQDLCDEFHTGTLCICNSTGHGAWQERYYADCHKGAYVRQL